MRPRYAADYRTLLWLALAAANAIAIWKTPSLRAYLVPLQCYFALTAGLVAHNHNHCPTFKSRRMNALLNHVATVFYGFAAFSWIPTHNNNHHKHANGPGDATRTWRYFQAHNLLVALSYPFTSMVAQVPVIDAYVREAKATKPAVYRGILIQLFICWGLPLALTLIDWRATVAAVWIPRLFSVYVIIFFNYVQHVDADPTSKWNHSRSFTGRVLNFFLFNNGFHAVHHQHPGVHWSELPALHWRYASNIDPSLNHVSFAAWLFRTYLVAPFRRSFGTRPLARPWLGPADAE